MRNEKIKKKHNYTYTCIHNYFTTLAKLQLEWSIYPFDIWSLTNVSTSSVSDSPEIISSYSLDCPENKQKLKVFRYGSYIKVTVALQTKNIDNFLLLLY